MNGLRNTLEENQITMIQQEEYIQELKDQLHQQDQELQQS